MKTENKGANPERNEARFAGSAEQLISIIENINAGVSMVVFGENDMVSFTYANGHFYDIFGYTKEQFAAEMKASDSAIYPEDADYVGSVIESIRKTKHSATFRFRALKRDGKVIQVRCNSSFTHVEGLGEMVLLSVLTDITASSEAEQKALVFGQRLNAIFENINNGISASMINEDGKRESIFTTDRCFEIVGYTREQYNREISHPTELIYSEDAEYMRRELNELVNVGDRKLLQFRAVRRDGSIIWVSANISVMQFADKDCPVKLNVFADITHMVEVNEQLTASHDHLNHVMNSTPVGIAVMEVDPDDVMGSMRTVFFNDSYYSFSGYSREEYTAYIESSELSLAFGKDAPALINTVDKICRGEIGNTADCAARFHTKDGGYRWLLLTGKLAERRGRICTINISQVDITERNEAAEKQRISEEMLRIAAETDKRTIIIYDIKNNSCNVENSGLYMLKAGEIYENIPQSFIDMGAVTEESEEELCTLFQRIRSGEQMVSASIKQRTGPNEYQWFEFNSNVITDFEGKPDHAVIVVHNINEQLMKEAVFQKWQHSIDSRPEKSFTMLRCNLSKDAGLEECSGGLLKMQANEETLTFNEQAVLYAERYIYPEDRQAYLTLLDSKNILANFYRGERNASLEYRELNDSGEPLWRLLTVETVEYPNSRDVQAFLMYEDIDERKKAELKKKEQAERDPLTGALNRMAFAEKVDGFIQREAGAHNALLMMDMDGFKLLNDTFGHAAGDQALIDATAILNSLVRDEDLVCRLGGDEFLVWLRNVPYDAVTEKIAKQICTQLRKAFSLEVQMSVSIGIAEYPRDGHNFDQLYHSADKALYKVKQAGKDNFSFFSTADDESVRDGFGHDAEEGRGRIVSQRARRRMLIVDDSSITREILGNMFKSEYQIEEAKNGTEAMIRLRHFGGSISIVLLDLTMPGIDGFEVLKRIQNNVELRTIPVIVVSGDEQRDTLLRAIESGATDYIVKPIDPDLIKLRVRSAISKAENERLRAQNSYLQLQRDEEMKFHTVLESTGTVVVEYNWRNHVFIYDNTISKYLAGKYDHRGLWEIFLAESVADSTDVQTLQNMLLSLANNRKENKASFLVMLKTASMEKHWFRINIYKKCDDFGLAEKMIITFNDVHNEVLANEKLLFQATRDELTGLYNRTGFIEKAAEMIAEKEPGYYVMASVDIEKFKVINDQFGTEKGDQILRQFAQTISKLHTGENGICCRITGDNFAILYPRRLMNTIELTQSHWNVERLDGTLPPIRFVAGRYVVNDKTLDVSAIYDRAAIAKDTVKGRYDVNIATFDESMRASMLRLQEITGQMNEALKNGQFEVWLQPQFNHVTGMLSGAEALVRWRHPEEGIISPAEFIPIFEKNGFVYEVDKFVWEETCKLLRGWLDRGMNPAPVSVNISRYDVFRDDLIDIVEGLVRKYKLPVDLLRLEITESAFSESAEQIIQVVKKFGELGFTVEIDDFGSGYSSLNTLKDVPAQVLKMDMRFLENDSNAQRGGSIIESVIRMAKWLGMSVIAEGVETIEQADYLKSIGCKYIQGYLYSHPVQTAEYERFLTEKRTEPGLEKLHTLDTWNNNAFWNPKSMETLIFNSYVGGACIFEYKDGVTELLRYNDAYANIFLDRLPFSFSSSRHDILSVLDENSKAMLKELMDNCIDTGKEASGELNLPDKNDVCIFIRLTMRQIAKAGGRHLFYCVVSDITAQRAAEQRERDAASRVAAIMDNMNGGITAVTSKNGRPSMIFSNDRFYSQLGYTREQFDAEMPIYFNAIHPEDRGRVLQKVNETLTTRKRGNLEYRCIKRDGSIINIRSNIALCRIEGIDDDVMITVETDITELVEAQQKGDQTTSRMQAIMAHISCGVAASMVSEGKLVYLFANDRFYELMDRDKAEYDAHFTGKFDAVHPDDREMVSATMRQAEIDRKPFSLEYRIICKNGDIRWLLSNVAVVHLEGIDAPVHLTALNDTTALHMTKQKEEEANERMKAVLDRAGNGITAISLNGDEIKFLFANEKFFEILGCTREEYFAKTQEDVLAFVHPDDREKLRADVTEANRTLQNIPAEFRVIRPDGSIVWVHSNVTLTHLTGIDVPVQITAFSDITEQKEAYEQLSFLNAAARAIMAQPDTETAINDTLDNIRKFFGAGRAYIMEEDTERRVTSNSYESCADGVPSVIDARQDLPIGMSGSRSDKYTLIEDVSSSNSCNEVFLQMLQKQGVSSTVIIPLQRRGNLFGTIGVDNPTKTWAQPDRLKALGAYIAILLTRRDMDKDIILANAAMGQLTASLLDNLPTGAALFEYDGETLSAVHINNRYWQLVERERVDYARSSVLKVVHADDAANVKAELNAAVREQRDVTVDCRIRCGSSGYKAFHVVMTAEKEENGKYLFYASFAPLFE